MFRYIRFIESNEWIEMGHVPYEIRNAVIETACFMGGEESFEPSTGTKVITLNGREVIRMIPVKA